MANTVVKCRYTRDGPAIGGSDGMHYWHRLSSTPTAQSI